MTTQTINCTICGKAFVRASNKGQPPKYCSRKCKTKAAYQQQLAREGRTVQPPSADPTPIAQAASRTVQHWNELRSPTETILKPVAPSWGPERPSGIATVTIGLQSTVTGESACIGECSLSNVAEVAAYLTEIPIFWAGEKMRVIDPDEYEGLNGVPYVWAVHDGEARLNVLVELS